MISSITMVLNPVSRLRTLTFMPPVFLSPHNSIAYLTRSFECLLGIPHRMRPKRNFPLSFSSVSSPVFLSSRNGTTLHPRHSSCHAWCFHPPLLTLSLNQPPTVSSAPQMSLRSHFLHHHFDTLGQATITPTQTL